MRVDVSYGRWGRATSLRPVFVTIAPGWHRLEVGRLCIEVDDQPCCPCLPGLLAVVGAAAWITLETLA